MRKSNQGQAHTEMLACIQKKNKIIQEMQEIQDELLQENYRLELELKEALNLLEELL